MGVICKCPGADTLPSVGNVTCPETLGQVVRLAFQRVYDSNGDKVKFTTSSEITKKASWTAFLSASDDTKIVLTPLINAPTTEPGEPITDGGGNETAFGIEDVVGIDPTAFSATFRKVPQEIIKQLQELQCEQNLGVYLFDENGAIKALKGEGTDDYMPIPIFSFFVGDLELGGKESVDKNSISFKFRPRWSSDTKNVVPEDFNPVDLKNA